MLLGFTRATCVVAVFTLLCVVDFLCSALSFGSVRAGFCSRWLTYVTFGCMVQQSAGS